MFTTGGVLAAAGRTGWSAPVIPPVFTIVNSADSPVANGAAPTATNPNEAISTGSNTQTSPFLTIFTHLPCVINW